MNNFILGILNLVVIILVAVSAVIFSRTELGAARRNFAQRFHSRAGDMSTNTKTPVYFLSHGGPNIIYEIDHPVYPELQAIGREITQKVKPKAVIVFSAHWRGGPDVVEVNTNETAELIYDFYGFPSHYYKETYPNVGSKPIAQKVIDSLTAAGIKTKPTSRGLDHGVWSSFKVAFNPEANPLNIPIVQVSLFANEDPIQHYAIGRAVESLRSQDICIIVSGMAVHNMRDMRFFGKVMPYTISFDKALKEAAESNPEEREDKMVKLLQRADARPAHPTFEHLLPIHVGAGAAGGDRGKRLWTLTQGSFSWAQYRFGEVGAKN